MTLIQVICAAKLKIYLLILVNVVWCKSLFLLKHFGKPGAASRFRLAPRFAGFEHVGPTSFVDKIGYVDCGTMSWAPRVPLEPEIRVRDKRTSCPGKRVEKPRFYSMVGARLSDFDRGLITRKSDFFLLITMSLRWWAHYAFLFFFKYES